MTEAGNNHIEVGGHKVDVDHMVHWLERGSTAILETVMKGTTSTKERNDLLDLVQKTNEVHRKTDASLPTLTFTNTTDFPSSWGRDLTLDIKRANERERTIYEELDWKGDDNKDHRSLTTHLFQVLRHK